MARSKEQWKAQQRALHTRVQSKSAFQMKRPGPPTPGARPSAPPAVFQLGRPTSAAPAAVTPVTPMALKPDPVPMPSQTTSSSGNVIDLTLDEEEEDEPMGDKQESADTVAVSTATTRSTTSVESSAALGAGKLSMLDGTLNPVSTLEMAVPLAEDVESDVDEEWPSVPPSAAMSVHPPVLSLVTPMVSSPSPPSAIELACHDQMREDVAAALGDVRKSVQPSQDAQEGNDLEQNVQVDSTKPPLYGDNDDDEMEADVDEELPNQAPKSGQNTAGSPTTPDRIVRIENLEDGEIFEEGVASKPVMQVQRPVMLDNLTKHFEHFVDAMGVRPHLRNKKQKKRGKKKTKRKIEAMQMMHDPPCEMLPEFERAIRQRPFADAPPPGQYTVAMMRNGPQGEPVNRHPMFQDSSPAPFRPGGVYVGVPRPPMRPPLQHAPTPPLPPPPPYEDSQILRVNRQGSMEMFDGDAELPTHAMFSEPPRRGGFKYRSVSMSPPRPASGEPIHPLQGSVSDKPRFPPIPPSGGGSNSNAVANRDREASDDFDLDSLRAAALRSKTKRPPQTSIPTAAEEITSSSSSSSSSPMPAHTHSEPTSPEIDKMRIEILRSMRRNRKRIASKAVQLPICEASATEKPNQSDGTKSASGNEDDKTANEISPVQTRSSSTKRSPESVLTKSCVADHIAKDESSKSTTAPEENEAGSKPESPLAAVSEAENPSVELTVTTPEYRPLTACSQSIVIRLNPDDFSPRKCGDSTRSKSTVSSSIHDAIKEMRRRIAEREKKQLENAATRRLKQAIVSSSSPASLSTSPQSLSPARKVDVLEAAQQSNTMATPPEVCSSIVEMVKESRAETSTDGIETQGTINGVNTQTEVSGGKEIPIKQVSSIETSTPAEAAIEQESPQKPASPREQDEISGVSTFMDMSIVPPVVQHQVPSSSDGRNGDPASEPCAAEALETTNSLQEEEPRDVEKPASSQESIPHNDRGKLDYDAIRAEYEQCVAECEEADMHIARLSKDMAQLEKKLPSIGSTVGGA